MDVRGSIEALKGYIEREGFKGYDPYDALNSPLLRALSGQSKTLKIIFTQALKRLPLNLRPLLLIKKDYNPKGLGLILWGYAKLFHVEQKAEHIETVNRILELLDSLKSPGWSGNCWGYNFHWQSRAFYLPKYTPTIVNSSFIGHALLDTHRYTGSERALLIALPIKDFILKDIRRTEKGGLLCFSYSPLDNTTVHNANLLGASLLARLYGITGEAELRDIALASLAFSMRGQNPNGSWYYADTDYQRWIDSFHTGFNLQSILYFLDLGLADKHREGFQRGIDFYSKHFFLDDGAPKYYHNRLYPIDIHCPAQALVFFSKMGGAYRELAGKIALWMVKSMQDRDGHFYFQKHRLYTNKVPYMRWSQAWAFHGLTEYFMGETKTL